MENLITKELEGAKQFYITTKEKDGVEIAELTSRNVHIAEAMIMQDSRYSKSAYVNNMESTAHWMNKLKGILCDNKEVTDEYYKTVIIKAVEAVDKDNTTHLNADKVGRKQISERLCNIPKEDLKEFLANPEGTGYKLIEIISKETTGTNKPRRNISFASKFCHYAAFYLFDGQEQQDNFSIYDEVLRKAMIKRYIPFYEIDADMSLITGEKKVEGYIAYQNAVDAVIEKADNQISRNGFDHLVWYYYKGRI